MRLQLVIACLLCCPLGVVGAEPATPVPLIFDTDIGNDVDDVLALGMIHALESRGECRLLAVTITKDHELAAPFTDAVNTFYGREDVPIGVTRSGVTPTEGKFNGLAARRDGDAPRFPHDLVSGKEAPGAVDLLRRTLAAAEDGSVVVAQVGFSTNLAGLLASKPDDVSPLDGPALVARKVRLLSIMAGAFELIPDREGVRRPYREYNVIKDLASARTLAERWPTPVVWSGFEVGIALPYPHRSIERDFRWAPRHPLPEAYGLYNPPPHDRPTWDLTSVLHAVRPDHDYFELSPPGRVQVDEEGYTRFEAVKDGPHRYLIAPAPNRPRILEAMQLLASQPVE